MKRYSKEISLIKSSGFFDIDWYLSEYIDVRISGICPVEHYLRFGALLLRKPSHRFDTRYYLESNPDVTKAGANPLVHYLQHGVREGRRPLPPEPHPVEHSSPNNNPALRYEDVEPITCSYFTPRGRLDAFTTWQIFNKPNDRYRRAIDQALDTVQSLGPKFSVVIPVFDPPLHILGEAIESVLKQSYASFEIILVDDCSRNPEVRSCLAGYAKRDKRILVVMRETNGHISDATNSGVDRATGDFLVFLDNDDRLDLDALALFACYIVNRPETDILYSDDAKIDGNGPTLISPKFKPEWSPELLLSYCYISHLKALRRSLYLKIGGSRKGYEGSQDHDMLLRASEHARHIGHVPQILYHRRVIPGSTAASGHEKPYAFEAGRKAVEDAFRRRGVQCEVIHPDWAFRAGVGIYTPVMPDNGPSVAIIIPTKNNHQMLERLMRSLRKTTYLNFKIVIIDNESDQEDTVRYLSSLDCKVIRVGNPEGGFSYAYINNVAVQQVDSEYVLFLNDDTEVIESRWLSQMMGWARLQGVGAVGARLLFQDGRVQHGGVVITLRNGLTAFRGLPRESPGYLWYAKVTRNTSAVSAAAMLTSRRLFLDMGGFDEKRFGVAYNDVDYCLRLQDAGCRIVYCGEAELYHHEGYTRKRGDKPSEIAAFRQRYGTRRDTMYSPHLGRDDNRYGIKPSVVPPVRLSRPMRVLAVTHNLNHEGAPNSAFELIAGLARDGAIEPMVISPQDGPLRDTYTSAGIAVRILDRPRPTQEIKSMAEYEKRIAHVREQIDFSSYDLVYANTATTFWAIDAALRAGVPSIWNIRESESWKSYFDYVPPEVASHALTCFSYPYRTIFVADATRKRWSPLDRLGNFEVIHNGLDLDRFCFKGPGREKARSVLRLSSDEICLLSVGTTAPRKGQHEIIQAIAMLRPEIAARIKVFIVGVRENAYSKAMRELLDALPETVSKSINLLPESGDTAVFWDAADAFVFTSRMESYPRVILEAMSKGLPIIATPVFGVSEQLRNEINALFYKPGSIKELARFIERIVLDGALRTKLAANSIDVLNGLESYQGMLGRYAELFRAAAMSSPPTIAALN